MPYFREKTWLQMAPPIRGLSVKESPYGFSRGMGQACDPTDIDCLNAMLPVTGAYSPLMASTLGTNVSGTALTPSSALPGSFQAWLQQNGLWVLLGGGALLLVAGMGMKMR